MIGTMVLHADLHIHSCLSPCADDEMTPYNLAHMAKIAGLDMIALTDHNSCLNCGAAMEAGLDAGITVVPGMELCTSEEVHIICLFPTLEKAEAFSDFVYESLPDIKNRPEIFGEQLVMDAMDNVISACEKLLTAACAVSVSHAVATVGRFGGVCYPAHIDRPSYSLLSNLGSITPEMGFKATELSALANINELKEKYPVLNEMHLVKSSDSHRLESIGEVFSQICLNRNDSESLVYYFNKLFSKIS